MINVYVDSREKGAADDVGSRASRAKEYFEQQGVRAQIRNLEFGDYLFIKDKEDARVCFEYKTIDDYMNSLHNGSLFEETYNQSCEYDYSYVIIEGNLNDYVRHNNYLLCDVLKLAKKFSGSLCRLRTFCNVIMVKNEREAFSTMFKQAEKCFNMKIYGFSKRKLPELTKAQFFLSGCSGVSHQLIENISEMYSLNSLQDLLNLKKEDLIKVPKIGKKKAEKIYNYING